jgi:hypothetical protein
LVVTQAAGDDEFLHHNHAFLSVRFQPESGGYVNLIVRFGITRESHLRKRLRGIHNFGKRQHLLQERNPLSGSNRFGPQIGENLDLMLFHVSISYE